MILGLSFSPLRADCFEPAAQPEIAAETAPRPTAFKKSRRFKTRSISQLFASVFAGLSASGESRENAENR
jgi:hypothetical protein